MLLEFKVKNYKSFKEEAVLSLIPAPKQKDLEYSILTKTIGNTNYRALSTSVLYGPNASGKTNIIGAIETLISIINRGNIKNHFKSNNLNYAANNLELIPNKDLKEKKPVEFYISFIKNAKYIEYFLNLDLGNFLESNAKRQVLFEQLIVNNEVLFLREQKIETPKLKSSAEEKIINLLSENLNQEELFLANGFKNLINNVLFNEISDFFNNYLTVIYRADATQISTKAEPNKKIIKDKELSLVAHEIGALNSEIGFIVKDQERPSELTTFIDFKEGDKKVGILSEIFESYGTIRFLSLYPIIKNILTKGGVLIIDEFDASIHPMVLLDIVNIFHNDEINVNNAQLIFNTHNPIFLNPSTLRRDEIKFIDKDLNGSFIYALSDFKTSGERGVRKTEDYMKHYFINKYGAILDVDLSEMFKTGMKNEENY